MLTGGHNRAAIVGVGHWGAAVVAHLWPRLRMADRGRSLVSVFPGGMRSGPLHLSRLGDVVSYALVLPAEDGSLTVARPQPERWNDVSFGHQSPSGDGIRLETNGQHAMQKQGMRELRRETYRALWPTLDVVGRYQIASSETDTAARNTFSLGFSEHGLAIGSDLAAILEEARADASTPSEDISQLTLFIVSALADELATAVLWPLTEVLRDRVGSRVLIEQVGLLSTGIYCPPSERRFEEAAVHVALQELEHLTAPPESPLFGAEQSEPAIFFDQHLPPFDRTYLIDREKTSGALIKDEVELTTLVGNALEALLTTDGNAYLYSTLAPDSFDLRRSGPFSSLGAASTYVPIEEMWNQVRQRLSLMLLRDHVLTDLPEDLETLANEMSERFINERLSVQQLSRPLLEDGFVEMEPDPQSQSESGTTGLPSVRVQNPPSAFLYSSGSTEVDLAGRAEAINQQFDEFESQDLADWAADIEKRSLLGISASTNSADSGEAHSVLDYLDEDIVALLTTLDLGMQTAQIYVAHLVEDLRVKRENLKRVQRQLQRDISSGESLILQNRLSVSESKPLRLLRSAWPILLGALALLVFIVVLLVSLDNGLAVGAALARALFLAAVVGLLGIALMFFIQRWLRNSLEKVYAHRQSNLDTLAQAYLAEALNTQLSSLYGEVQKRRSLLQEALNKLEKDEGALAKSLSDPAAPSYSFLRQPLAEDELNEGIRVQPSRLPEEPIKQAFRVVSDGEATLSKTWRVAVQADASSRDAGTVAGVGEVYGLVLDRFAARLSQTETLAHINVEEYLPYAVPDHMSEDFVVHMHQWAKPCIHLNDRLPASPISIDLLAVPYTPASEGTELGMDATRLHTRLLSSYNPFTLIMLRTVHGFPLTAVEALSRYAASYESLSAEQRKALLLADGVSGD